MGTDYTARKLAKKKWKKSGATSESNGKDRKRKQGAKRRLCQVSYMSPGSCRAHERLCKGHISLMWLVNAGHVLLGTSVDWRRQSLEGRALRHRIQPGRQAAAGDAP